MKVDEVEVCQPMEQLLNQLLKQGFNIEEARLADYHFQELYFQLIDSDAQSFTYEPIIGIKRCDNCTFTCDCHWSTVKLISK